MELIKPIVKVGNSAGVVLPKEWLNGKARVILIEKPADIKKELLEILDEYMESVIGIALVGSYARREETADSDIDVLVITYDLAKKVRRGKYEIIMVPENELKNELRKNALPLLPMLAEAKPIMNKVVFERYKNEKITKENLRWHIETTLSALKIVEKSMELAEQDNKYISDGIMYSLILRLRELYIVDCLLQKKNVTKKNFVKLVKEISGLHEPYYAYIRSKNNEKDEKKVRVESALKIYQYLYKKIKEQKHR